jgi:hypothetical protein
MEKIGENQLFTTSHSEICFKTKLNQLVKEDIPHKSGKTKTRQPTLYKKSLKIPKG